MSDKELLPVGLHHMYPHSVNSMTVASKSRLAWSTRSMTWRSCSFELLSVERLTRTFSKHSTQSHVHEAMAGVHVTEAGPAHPSGWTWPPG